MQEAQDQSCGQEARERERQEERAIKGKWGRGASFPTTTSVYAREGNAIPRNNRKNASDLTFNHWYGISIHKQILIANA